MTQLHEKVCIACLPDAEPASADEIQEFIGNSDWRLIEDDGVPQISRKYVFDNFEQALAFTNMVAEIAEEEGHHPKIITEWGSVSVLWWSHKIKNIHINDLILVSITDLQTQKVYLFYSNGTPVGGFPVFGNGVVDISNADDDAALELVVTAGEKEILIYQINF